MRQFACLSLISFVSLSLFACSKEPERHVKTPDELLEEELAKADQAGQRNQGSSATQKELDDAALADGDRFDEENAEYELKRSSIGARSCPDSFSEEQLEGFKPGTAELKVYFANDGQVTKVELGEAYADTMVGDCVERAFSSAQIRPFVGEEEAVDWKVELKLSPKEEE